MDSKRPQTDTAESSRLQPQPVPPQGTTNANAGGMHRRAGRMEMQGLFALIRLVCPTPDAGCSVLQKCGRAIGACLHAKVRLLSAEDGEQK